MLNFIDPIQQRKAMTEAGFSVSEQNIILAEVQNTHYCTDEKPSVPEGMPYKSNVQRDRRKKTRCGANGITVLYWDYDQPVTDEYFKQAIEPLLQRT